MPFFFTILLGYFGFQVGFRRREEFVNLLNRKEKDKRKSIEPEAKSEVAPTPKILDTSVIIDGRVADICQTSFLEGTIVIPQFVLEIGRASCRDRGWTAVGIRALTKEYT